MHPNFFTWITERAPFGIIDLGRGGCNCQITCEKCNITVYIGELDRDDPTGEWWCVDCKPKKWSDLINES